MNRNSETWEVESQLESAVIPVTEAAAAPRAPMHVRYLRLIRTNANFRRLWLAQLVSEIGDWFYSLAIYDLLLETTHSGKAVSYAIIIQTQLQAKADFSCR